MEEGCDIVGLSGLITPSLDEMVHVADEMERRGLDLPLLIGGATTSRQHTAVKIAPAYGQPTLHVLDASRVVGGRLRPARARAAPAARPRQPRGAGEAARAPRGEGAQAAAPAGGRARAADADRLARGGPAGASLHGRPRRGARPGGPATVRRLDLFFHAWELKGRFPKILDDPVVGEAARDLFENAERLLDEIVAGGLLRARGVYGFWPAAAEGDDLALENGVRFPMLRQQVDHADSRPNRSLADFVAPVESGLVDHVGAFAVTAGLGADELADGFAAEHDDYRSIMVKALADRLAEAFAEYLHEVARREWYERGRPALERRPDRGALPRHPPRVRLSRPAPTTP